MALSFHTNWSSYDTNVASLFQPPSPSPELFPFHDDSTIYETGINTIFDKNFSNNAEYMWSNYSVIPNGNVFTMSHEFQDPYYNLPYLNTIDNGNLFPVEYTMGTELSSQLPPLLESSLTYHSGGFANALSPWYDCRGGQSQVEEVNIVQVKKQDVGKGGGSLSAQSMAARVRRRKISEKTQELGKLIPRCHKKNTAEMFQAAYKYIKFLQAQIGVLKLMASLRESEEVLSNGELQALVTCTLMQEKLYTAEKCIGPKTLTKPCK